ncbi:MAG: hypothetical protein ACI311_03310 [Bacilli bacterium]
MQPIYFIPREDEYIYRSDDRMIGPLLPFLGGFLLAEVLPPFMPYNYGGNPQNQYYNYPYPAPYYQANYSYPSETNTYTTNTYQMTPKQPYMNSYSSTYPYYKSTQSYY